MKRRGKTRHFTAVELADYARKVAPKDQQESMKQHLENCGKCAKTADTWRHLVETAHRPPTPEPPQAAVRVVKALYSVHGPKRAATLKSLAADLLFDSSLAPLQAGVRSTATTARQLLFGSGDYRVDLRIEPQDDTDQVSLLGQILHATDGERNLSAVPVALVEGRRLLAQALTNEHGEFHLECDLTPRLELRLMLPDFKVAIPLVEPLRDASEEKLYLLGEATFKSTSTRGKH